MRTLTVALLVTGLMSVAAAAQQNKPHCPTGYDLIGTLCQNGSTGDIVLPD